MWSVILLSAVPLNGPARPPDTGSPFWGRPIKGSPQPPQRLYGCLAGPSANIREPTVTQSLHNPPDKGEVHPRSYRCSTGRSQRKVGPSVVSCGGVGDLIDFRDGSTLENRISGGALPRDVAWQRAAGDRTRRRRSAQTPRLAPPHRRDLRVATPRLRVDE